MPHSKHVNQFVDLVLFLRGYDIKRPKSATLVSEYWNSPQQPVLKSFLLGEEVNASGKNVILTVPAVGPFSEFGSLKDDRGLEEFFARILEGLWRSGPHAGQAKRPTIHFVNLAAHSSGEVPLRRIAEVLGKNDPFKDNLKKCCGFDSIY